MVVFGNNPPHPPYFSMFPFLMLHKQSVEETRRRLEEYQHTLRNRYSGKTTAKCLPPGTKARPLPHFKGGIIPPVVPLELPSVSALLPCLPVALSTHSRAYTPLDLPTPSILAQTLFLPGTTVCSHINSRASPVQLEPTAKRPKSWFFCLASGQCV